MCVQNHKTGYKQPAIIFLEDEIFQFLLQYVTILLPSLPPLVPNRGRTGLDWFRIGSGLDTV